MNGPGSKLGFEGLSVWCDVGAVPWDYVRDGRNPGKRHAGDL